MVSAAVADARRDLADRQRVALAGQKMSSPLHAVPQERPTKAAIRSSLERSLQLADTRPNRACYLLDIEFRVAVGGPPHGLSAAHALPVPSFSARLLHPRHRSGQVPSHLLGDPSKCVLDHLRLHTEFVGDLLAGPARFPRAEDPLFDPGQAGGPCLASR